MVRTTAASAIAPITDRTSGDRCGTTQMPWPTMIAGTALAPRRATSMIAGMPSSMLR